MSDGFVVLNASRWWCTPITMCMSVVEMITMGCTQKSERAPRRHSVKGDAHVRIGSVNNNSMVAFVVCNVDVPISITTISVRVAHLTSLASSLARTCCAGRMPRRCLAVSSRRRALLIHDDSVQYRRLALRIPVLCRNGWRGFTNVPKPPRVAMATPRCAMRWCALLSSEMTVNSVSCLHC